VTSIRGRTSLLVAASIAGLLALGGLALFVVVRAALTRQFDDGLAARAAALQSLTRFDGEKVEMDIAGEVMPRYHAGKDAEYFVAWIREGNRWNVLEQSESLPAAAWPGDGPPAPEIVDCPLPSGRPGRSLTIEFIPPAEHDSDDHESSPAATTQQPPSQSITTVRLLVAQSRTALDRTLWTIALSISGVGIALVVASIAATRWAVRRGTRPLEALCARVAALGPETLNQRLTLEHQPMELGPVAARLNDLLARLDEAFKREKSFTSAASHELRTPIAELRMLLEVALSRERTPERWEKTARDGLGVLDRAQLLTEALLRLSRAGAGSGSAPTDATADLAAILRQQAARALEVHGHDPSHLSIDAPDALAAPIDPALAASIIGNMLDNALHHGDVAEDRPARCIARQGSAGVSITITNYAPTLTTGDVAHLFEPFWRKDPARSPHDARQGFGLGLSVGRVLAESAGGRITAVFDADHQLGVTFQVPLSR